MLDSLSPGTREWVEAALILLAFWVPAIAIRALWHLILSPWIKRSRNPDLALLVRPLRTLAVWTLLLSGVNYAFQSLNFAESHPALGLWTQRAIAIAWVILAGVIVSRYIHNFFYYKARKNAKGDEEVRDRMSTPQKLATAAIMIVGGLFILQIAGVDVSPLLAGGAVGGIIIGLALQDSLSNVFAGLFINMDRPIQVGDLLRLDQDREGFVEEVGWRYTKVRLWNDSMLLIPNNKFGQSSFINFNRPVSELQVSVDIGVAYDSDLEQVERVAIEAALAAQAEVNDSGFEFAPYVRWRSFGDYAIQFRVYCRADHATKQYRLTSACIKQVFSRFRQEGIVIPIPERTIHMKLPETPHETPRES